MPGEHAFYFLRRAREERDKAENAPDPRSYRLHLELAREYEIRARHAWLADESDARIGGENGRPDARASTH